MKILFTSDLHSDKTAYRKFAMMLCSRKYDCGVIAGDLMDDDPLALVVRDSMQSNRNSFDNNLSAEGTDFDEALERHEHCLYTQLIQAMNMQEETFKSILFTAMKPIFVVTGNHDKTSWKSERNVYNIHLKKVRFKGHTFVGYCHTDFDKWDKDMAVELQRIKHHIDGNTVLVTHAPAYGVLDQRYSGKCSTGSRAIAQVVAERRPTLHLHGHVHDQCGHSGRSVNGAFCDSKSLFAIDLDRNTIRRIGGTKP